MSMTQKQLQKYSISTHLIRKNVNAPIINNVYFNKVGQFTSTWYVHLKAKNCILKRYFRIQASTEIQVFFPLTYSRYCKYMTQTLVNGSDLNINIEFVQLISTNIYTSNPYILFFNNTRLGYVKPPYYSSKHSKLTGMSVSMSLTVLHLLCPDHP